MQSIDERWFLVARVAGGTEGSGLVGELNCPSAIVLRPDGGLYVADMGNHRVLAFDAGSNAGRIVAGGRQGSGLVGELNRPKAIVLRPDGGLYVADRGNNRVLAFDAGSNAGRIVAGGTEGSGLVGELNFPSAIALRPDGGLYVADMDNDRVLAFDAGSNAGRIVAGGTKGSGLVGELNWPSAIALRPDGGLYVADIYNHRVLLIDSLATESVESAFTSKKAVEVHRILAGGSDGLMARISSMPCACEFAITSQRQVLELVIKNHEADLDIFGRLVILWGADHIQQMLESTDADSFADERGRGVLMSKIMQMKAEKYGVLAVAKDSVLPVVDYALDNIGLVTYIFLEQYDFFSIVVAGILFNVIATAYVMMQWRYGQGRYGKWGLTLHVLTFGLYGFVAEARHCSQTGKKTELLSWMKNFELVESMISFGVGTYTILISGYLDGFKPLKGLTLGLRYASVISSLLTLPLGAFDFGMRELARESFQMSQASTPVSRYVAGYSGARAQLMLFLFHASEVQCQITLLLVQLATRPWGIFILLTIEWLLMFNLVRFHGEWDFVCCGWRKDFRDWFRGIFGFRGESILVFVFTPFAMIVNPVAGKLFHRILKDGILARTISIVRVLTIVGAWATLVIVWRMGGMDESIISQVTSVACLPLSSIALLGSLLHLVMFIQQSCAGRFEPFKGQAVDVSPAYQTLSQDVP